MSRKDKLNESHIYNNQVDKIRTRLDGREYNLGITATISNLSASVVALEPGERGGLIPTVPVFTTNRTMKPSAGAKDRRTFRGSRNAIRHKRKRMAMLWQTLTEKGLMLPYTPNKDTDAQLDLRFPEDIYKKDVYTLRLEGLSEELTLPELGYALYHMAKHRGSASVSSEDMNDKTYAEAMEQTKEAIAKYGKHIYIELLEAFRKGEELNRYRNRGVNLEKYTPRPMRDLIEAELDALLAKQAEYHPELDAEYIKAIKNAVMYENEQIVPLPGNCPFFTSEKKVSRISFLAEEKRIWEALNNVRYVPADIEDEGDDDANYENAVPLDDRQRQEFFNYLWTHGELKEAQVRKEFSEFKDVKVIKLQGSVEKDTKIKGCQNRKLRDNAIFKSLDEDTREDILALWANSAYEDKFRIEAEERFNLSSAELDELVKLLPASKKSTYLPVGRSALRIIMPYIKDRRLSHQQAVDTAIAEGKFKELPLFRDLDHLPYYGAVLPLATQELAGKAFHPYYADLIRTKGFIRPSTCSEEELHGKIGNSVVHQIMNELKDLINEIIDIIGYKPAAIIFEIAKDLKLSEKERKELALEMNKLEKLNIKIYTQYCEKDNLGYGKVRPFKLWEEQKHICPYCLKDISEADIRTGRAELDHIFPESDIPGNPENNLVIAHAECNARKNNRIPHTAFGTDKLWPSIQKNAEDNLNKKAWRFNKTEEDYRKWLTTHGWNSRFVSDSAYISRLAREYLSVLFDDADVRSGIVRGVRSGDLNILMNKWGLARINDRIRDEYRTCYGMEPGKTPDLRSYALRAITLAYSVKAVVPSKGGKGRHPVGIDSMRSYVAIPEYFKGRYSDFYKTVEKEVMRNCFISRKIDKGLNGPLLEATAYSFLADNGKMAIYSKSSYLATIGSKTLEGTRSGSLQYDLGLAKDLEVSEWVPEKVKGRLERMIEHNRVLFERVESNLDKAREILLEEARENTPEGKEVKQPSDASVLKKSLEITGGRYHVISTGDLGKRYVKKSYEGRRAGTILETGENARIDLYHDKDGELRGEVIRRIDAMNRKFVPDYVKAGYERFETLQLGDIVVFHESPSKVETSQINMIRNTFDSDRPYLVDGTLCVITTYTKKPNGAIQLYMKPLSERGSLRDATFTIGGNNKLNFSKVVMSKAGLIRYYRRIA